MKDLTTLSATDAATLIADGRLASVDLVKACLDKIAQTDGPLQAWAFVDTEGALVRAAEMDRIRKAGGPLGALHGVPVGLKDIIDTKEMPTARGTPIFAGRQSDADAAIVERLQEAGAVILGKTVTTELAFMHAADTRNPHNPDRTPGGSSSGSAAAVAAGQVPLAIGTQTNGSVIRPASFCGVFGIKPTCGLASRRGLLQTSISLDQIGCFGRTLEDTALLCDAISGYDPADTLSYAHPRPNLARGCASEPAMEPNLIWLNQPYHDRLSSDAEDGFEAVIESLGARVERFPAPDNMASLIPAQSTIHLYEICQHLGETFDADWDQISDTLQPMITKGRAITKDEYEHACGLKLAAEAYFDTFFHDYDAVIAPSAAGEAPVFGPVTGDPIFCTIWTLAGLPCVTVPALVGETGLPIGLQLIGASERDDRLMSVTNWVLRALSAQANEEAKTCLIAPN